MALCAKRNSIELALRQQGSEAATRSIRAVRHLSTPFTVSKADVPHTHACMALCRKRNSIELAVRQQGSEAAKRSTEQAAEQAAKEGSAVGLLRVLLKEHDHDNVQMVQLAAKPLLLQDLKVCGQRSRSLNANQMVEAPVVTRPRGVCSTVTKLQCKHTVEGLDVKHFSLSLSLSLSLKTSRCVYNSDNVSVPTIDA